MTIYRVTAAHSHVYPDRHRVRWLSLHADGRATVRFDDDTVQEWHAPSTALQYHGVAWWDLRGASGLLLEPPAALERHI